MELMEVVDFGRTSIGKGLKDKLAAGTEAGIIDRDPSAIIGKGF